MKKALSKIIKEFGEGLLITQTCHTNGFIDWRLLGQSSHLRIESGSCEPNTGQSGVRTDCEVCAKSRH
jgi:hypothetical protein